jgi:hypothetical protein
MGQGTLGASKCPLCPIETDADESWLLQMNVALPICKQLEGEAEIVLSPSRRTESARQRLRPVEPSSRVSVAGT